MFKIINEIGLENTTELKSVESVLEDILAEDFSDITKWKVAELANVQFIMYEYHGKKCFPSIRVLNYEGYLGYLYSSKGDKFSIERSQVESQYAADCFEMTDRRKDLLIKTLTHAISNGDRIACCEEADVLKGTTLY